MKSRARKVIFAAMAANLLIACTKFFAAWFTGSSATLSEGVHSLVDTGDQILLLYGLHRAGRPADAQFPFGHGKEIYFWSFVVAILIFALGAGISAYEGILHLLHPRHMVSPTVSYLTLGAAAVFEAISWVISVREFGAERKSGVGFVAAIHQAKDPTLFLVVMEDSAALLGLATALLGIFLAQVTGLALFDGLASVLIGVILGLTAIFLARETKGLLVGEAADPESVRTIREIVSTGKHVEHVNEVLTLHMGPEFVVTTIGLDFVDDVTAGEVEKTIVTLEREIRQQVPAVKKVFIEAEAWCRGRDAEGDAPCVEEGKK